MGSILIIFGIFTPLAIPLTVLIDNFIVWNLGSRMIFLTGLVIWLGNGWKYYSMDRLLINKLLVNLRQLYIFSNAITYSPKTIRTLGLLIWGGMTLTSASFHLVDEAWNKGYAVMFLLRTPYYNDFYEFFYSLNTPLLAILSKISCYLMMIWMAGLWTLPGIKLMRYFSFAMGLMFFISSILFINLSYLPYTELLFWILIHFPNLFLFRSNIFEDRETSSEVLPHINSSKMVFQKLLRDFIRFNIIISFIIFNSGSVLRIFSKNLRINLAFEKVLNNEYYRKWNKAWGQAPVDDFNSNDLYNYKYSIVGCRRNNDSTIDLVPWEDENGGRLSYLTNDEFFLRKSAPFKMETWQKSWKIQNDKKALIDSFRELSLEVASFDAALTNNVKKADYYTFYLIEHFVELKNGIPIGWSTSNNSIVRAKFDIDQSMLSKKSGIKYLIPPGHFFERKRTERTKKRFCKDKIFME